jgi:glutamyl-tRNA(Gln) amidotransferase subunit D
MYRFIKNEIKYTHMYSKEIQKILNSKKIKVGERISVRKGPRSYEGLLMPRIELGDPNSITIKLDNGYNMGILFDKKTQLSKSSHKSPKGVKEEEDYELGKVRKDLLKLSFDKSKPGISLIATGGTIASRVDYKTGGVAALEDPREFLHNVPELKKIAHIKNFSKPFTKMSEDMDSDDWIKIAKEVHKELLKKDIKGVIITHGTDALHFTAAALSFFIRDLNKPVVLTGAQKSSDRGSSDAGMNMICSAYAATSDIAEVGICMHGSMNDSFCLFTRGTKVRKMDTVRRDAFRPINDYPIAKIYPDGRVSIVNKKHRKRSSGRPTLDAKFEPKVALIKAYPGSDPKIIDFYLKNGYKGFVIEGLGLGHVPTNGRGSWINTIKSHPSIPFVVCPQTLYGRINPNVYSNLRVLYHEAGAIPGEDMLPEVAYVKLGWVLAKTKDPEKVRKEMLTNHAGEIKTRSLPGTFLY